MSDTWPAMTVTRTGKRWAEAGDWEEKKPIIEQLYMKEDKNLREVMREMEEKHDFWAR